MGVRGVLAVLGFVFSASVFAGNFKDFPRNPDPRLTPGSVCQRPTEYRYPSRIPYCKRDVESFVKKQVIQTYDQQLGYHVGSMNRMDFKIDHLIPLCAGGSNEPNNLWPQHKSVYVVTDPLEGPLCELMARGKIRQQDAIKLLLDVKQDLNKAPAALRQIHSLL